MGAERHELTPEDGLWPQALRDLHPMPRRLYVMGDPAALGTGGLAIIGARKATPYGLATARMGGRIAAECGLTVVSGGALGCDAAALEAAQRAGGVTVVVAGTGADRIYPQSSEGVFRAAADNGCVVSLEPWGTSPIPYNFPKRNRVIAALAQALMVTEAGERSGTSGTAECAMELGREVYSVPGSIFSPESVGANRLISDGAAPIASEEDLETRISMDFGVLRLVSGSVGSRKADRIVSVLTANPMRPDDLANHLGMQPLELLLLLSDYEASGVLTRLPDGRYSPTVRAFLGDEG